MGEEIEQRGDEPGGRQGQHPGKDDVARDIPSDRRAFARQPDAGDRARNRRVVEIGVPREIAAKMVTAPPSSAQNPCIGLIWVMREPIVCTMRQPPTNVPTAIAA